MQTNVLEIKDLVKTYKNFNAVDHITLTVPKGSIFGLIGQNGAGKSTMMKMISGLTQKSEGMITLFGHDPKEDPLVYRRIGALIEAAGLYPSLNAYDNLKLKSLSLGIADEAVIQELLEICDLTATGKKKVKNFSMGMKQRLGIAMALLGNPELLILDEPTNGLDPQGINDIRRLLVKLNTERHMTIMISSHILEELSKIATNYAIIKKGKLIECLSDEELQNRCKDCFRIRVDDQKRTATVLEENCGVEEYEVLPDQMIQLYDHYEDASRIAEELVKHGVKIYEMYEHKQSLETYFLKRSGDEDVE